MQSKHTPAGRVALGGVLAALAVVIMSMGTLIPVATYVCPVLCMLLLKTVMTLCGRRIAWSWYGAVAILSGLMTPDREAAAVFFVLGYYPIIKPWLDRCRFPWLWKAVLFNVAILALYAVLLHLFGMSQLVTEFQGMGSAMLVILLILGNITFFLMDRLLGMRLVRRK